MNVPLQFTTVATMRLGLLVLMVAALGCELEVPLSNHDANNVANERVTAEVASQVPLRVWIVTNAHPTEILTRQWLSDSEQPIAVTLLSEEELLARKDCPADVLLMPTRLLGDAVSRKWLAKLPEPSVANPSDDVPGIATQDADKSSAETPQALIAATSYDGVRYGLSLGYSSVQLVGSRMADPGEMSPESLLERMSDTEFQSLEIDQSFIDGDALVDRFLAIAFAVSQANAKYGMLFEVRSMKSRLASDEFVLAADLLQRLANQPGGVQSVVGSHNAAWRWINATEHPAYALLSVTGLNEESRALENAHPIPFKTARSWNDGSAMMVALPAQCRQSAQATRFIKWLGRPRTVEALQPYIPGVAALVNHSGSLVDRIAQQTLQSFQDGNMPCEPRLPFSHDYRKALVNQLLAMLSGQKSSREALAAAAEAWDAITQPQRKLQQIEYERSLGITR